MDAAPAGSRSGWLARSAPFPCGLTLDEHGAPGAGHARDHVEHVANRSRRADDLRRTIRRQSVGIARFTSSHCCLSSPFLHTKLHVLDRGRSAGDSQSARRSARGLPRFADRDGGVNRRRARQARHGPRGVARTRRSEHASTGKAKSRRAKQEEIGARCVSHEFPRQSIAPKRCQGMAKRECGGSAHPNDRRPHAPTS